MVGIRRGWIISQGKKMKMLVNSAVCSILEKFGTVCIWLGYKESDKACMNEALESLDNKM